MANIGLVLSGGMAKGAYQVGVLKAIREFFDDTCIQYISSSSIGSLNAYAYVTNKLTDAESMWLNLKYDGIKAFLRTPMRKPYLLSTIDSLVESNDIIQKCLYITCFNITKAKLNYINLQEVDNGKIGDYLKASVSLPAFTNAVDISGMKYLDGALIDNIPVHPLMQYHLDYIIVVHFDNHAYFFENENFDKKLIKINFLDNRFIKNTLAFDHSSIVCMIQSGYEQTKNIFENIFKNGIDDLDFIYKKIAFINTLHSDKRARITGDIVLNNINKALKKVVPKNL